MNRKAFCLILWLSIMLWPAPPDIVAQQRPTESPLHGLLGVCVFVPSIQTEAEAKSLTSDKIQALIEARLRQDGIRVLTWDEMNKAPERPRLEVRILIANYRKGGVVYTVDMQLFQQVFLARESKIPVEASTWRYGPIMGQAYIENRPIPAFGIENIVEEGTRELINSYYYANPKK